MRSWTVWRPCTVPGVLVGMLARRFVRNGVPEAALGDCTSVDAGEDGCGRIRARTPSERQSSFQNGCSLWRASFRGGKRKWRISKSARSPFERLGPSPGSWHPIHAVRTPPSSITGIHIWFDPAGEELAACGIARPHHSVDVTRAKASIWQFGRERLARSGECLART